MEEHKTISPSDNKRYLMAGILIALPILVVLLLGLAVGKTAMRPLASEKRIDTPSAGTGATMRELGEKRGGMMKQDGRGTVLGLVTKTESNALTLKQNDKEVRVTIESSTSVSKNGEIAKFSDIKTGDVVIVNGQPGSDGAVVARSIAIN